MNQKKINFVAQLNSFRFFAVCLVIISHWLPGNIINRIPNGTIGVTFFFVLSGYLISTNLLYSKEAIDTGNLNIAQAIKFFYIRRTLRIFPLYYLAIALLFLANRNIFNGHIGWYLSYIPNYLIFKQQFWPGILAHFWSLGAEEQFYLIWPLFIFFIQYRHLKFFFSGIVVISVLCKLYFYLYMPANVYTGVLTISCFDAFGIGASLALLTLEKRECDCISDKAFWFYLACTIIVATFIFITGFIFLFGLLVSIASALVILKASKGFGGIGGKILNQPIFLYLGKISYGLYVYHNFVPWLVRCIRGNEIAYPVSIFVCPMNWLTHPIFLMTMQFLLTIALASVSWFVIEKPILNLKKHFT